MVSRNKGGKVTVNVFGFLRQHMDDQGLPYTLEKGIPHQGCAANELAQMLSLPMNEIEGVFRNGRVTNLYDPVFPGDRVAFFPYGTPGPYRAFLGILRENRKRAKRERELEKEKTGCVSKRMG